MSLLPFSDTREMVWDYIPDLNRSMLLFYQLLLILSAAGLFTLFLYRVPVSVTVSGVVRPELERTEVHPRTGGIIDKIFVREGDTVARNSLLLVLRDETGAVEVRENLAELTREENMVGDLLRLTATDRIRAQTVKELKTPLYRSQAAAYLSRENGESLNWSGARHDADLGRLLLKDKVISPKEFYDQELIEQKMRAALSALHRAQWAAWQSELIEHRQALSVCLNRQTALRSRWETLELRSPVSGIVDGLRGWYPGSTVRPDQPICNISPEGNLIGECHVSSRDAGLLRAGQAMRIRVDAFNANYFGVLTGHIRTISNDISFIDGRSVFIVRCGFDREPVATGNGYRGQLKKGLSFQARCIITERNLFQWLYDNLEDWLHPSGHSPVNAPYPV